MRSRWAAFLLIPILGAMTVIIARRSTAGSDTQIAAVDGGQLQGMSASDPSVTVYRGVPYAAPPIFDRRWQPPQPVAPWPGVRRADRFAPICLQWGRGWGEFYQEEFYQQPEPMSEDCLYLNIWTAAVSAAEKRPVLFWIHGGGFGEGSGSLPSFDGEHFATKGLVVVTINYRLNVFGFLAHPELTRESPHQSSGNYGLLDQIAALQWVQRNIAQFGGDPSQVTVAGQSAGAGSVHLLQTSPLAKGLFVRAIAQSGSSVERMVNGTKRSEAEHAGVAYATSIGATSLAELRAKPAAALLHGAFLMRPIVDGWVVPDVGARVYARRQQHDVPMLTGIMADEQIGFQPRSVSAAEFRANLTRRFGDQASAFLTLYPAASDDQALAARDLSARDESVASMRAWAAMREKTARTPLYVYFFSRPSPGGDDSERIGAFHSGEIEYVFGTLNATDRPWQDVDRQLSETVSSYWANFVKHGDPNGPGVPTWPRYTGEDGRFMELGEDVAPRHVLPAEARLAFFDNYYAALIESASR